MEGCIKKKISNKILNKFAKENRDRIHWVERRFKKELEKRGIRYEYQKVIKNYIVDFFLPERHLIVELDGNSHNGREKNDEVRERDLRNLRYRIIRFKNEFFINKTQNCFDMIDTIPRVKRQSKTFPRKVVKFMIKKCWHGRNAMFCTSCNYGSKP